MNAGPAHACEVGVAGEDRHAVRDCVRRDEKVECLHGRAAASNVRPEFPGILPEVRRLDQLMTTVQEREDLNPLRA